MDGQMDGWHWSIVNSSKNSTGKLQNKNNYWCCSYAGYLLASLAHNFKVVVFVLLARLRMICHGSSTGRCSPLA
jgi:hypothetical protein